MTDDGPEPDRLVMEEAAYAAFAAFMGPYAHGPRVMFAWHEMSVTGQAAWFRAAGAVLRVADRQRGEGEGAG